MKYLKWLIIVLIVIPGCVYAQNKAVIDITKTSIEDLEDALSKGYITSELLVQLYLERIEAYNSKFNAIREINTEALEEAKKLDEERRSGRVRSPLHGIVMVVKTNIDVQNLATTAGSKALSDNYPLSDASVIKSLKEAGVIILASTNMSEFAFSASNSYSSYGSVKNAFNPEYTPYGSSGGSAVALALSFASAALGTDTNSSVRLPASAAGLVGMRPSLGLVSKYGVIPYDLKRDTVGIMTKTVKDNALILQTIAKEDENDLDTKNAVVKDYLKEPNEPLKVGYISDFIDGSGYGINASGDKDITALVYEKINLLKQTGIDVKEIKSLLTSKYQTIATNTKTGSSFCDGFNNYLKNSPSQIKSFQDLASSSKKVYSLNDYLSSCNGAWENYLPSVNSQKKLFEDHVLQIMQDNDVNVIIYPTLKVKNLTLNHQETLYSPGSFLPSVIGYPALTVPMGQIGEFYYGLEFFSFKYNEDILYQVAQIFEEANNLELTNSNLAPSLYEIPIEVEELKAIYEQFYSDDAYQELNTKTRQYFLNYSSLSDEETLNEALALKEEYLNKEKTPVLNVNNSNNNHVILYFLTLIIYYLIIWIKLKFENIINQKLL